MIRFLWFFFFLHDKRKVTQTVTIQYIFIPSLDDPLFMVFFSFCMRKDKKRFLSLRLHGHDNPAVFSFFFACEKKRNSLKKGIKRA